MTKCEALAQGTLVELKTRLAPAVRRLAIVLHRDKRLGAGAQEFVRHEISRTLPLAYPEMLGAPLTIYRSQLPVVGR